YDIYKEGVSTKKVGTKEFADAVVANLGKKPKTLAEVSYDKSTPLNLPKYERKPLRDKQLKGVDLFVHWPGFDTSEIGSILQKLDGEISKLSMITNRGIMVWPRGFKETFCTDHWRCRFYAEEGKEMTKDEIVRLLSDAVSHDIDVIKTENLYTFEGKRAYSLGQGQ
ncbi:MAG: NADP-dependent isocitrate dehydrogenase, partial [Bacteroidota bacterium]